MGGHRAVVALLPGRADSAAPPGAAGLPPGGRGAHGVLSGGFPGGVLFLGSVQRVALPLPGGGSIARGAHSTLVVGRNRHIVRHLDAHDRVAAHIPAAVGDVESPPPACTNRPARYAPAPAVQVDGALIGAARVVAARL